MAKTNKQMGRPRLPRKEVRGRIVSARLRPEEAAEITDAIRKSGTPAAEWIRGALLGAARGKERTPGRVLEDGLVVRARPRSHDRGYG